MQASVCAYGRVTRKGVTETKTRKGNPVVRMTISVVVENRRTPEGGEEPEPTTPWWLNCLIFQEAERAGAKRLAAGDYVWVAGRVSRRPWKDKEGGRREEWTLMVDALRGLLPLGRAPISFEEPEEPEVAETDPGAPPAPDVTVEYEHPEEPAPHTAA